MLEHLTKPATLKFQVATVIVTGIIAAGVLAVVLPRASSHAAVVTFTSVAPLPAVETSSTSLTGDSGEVPATVPSSTTTSTTAVVGKTGQIASISVVKPAAVEQTTDTTTPGMPAEPVEQQKNLEQNPIHFEPCKTMSEQCPDITGDYTDWVPEPTTAPAAQ